MKEQFILLYNFQTNLFSANIKGVKYSLSHKELEFMKDLIELRLKDFPDNEKNR